SAVVIDSNNARNDPSRGYVDVTDGWISWAAGSTYWGTGYWVGITTGASSDVAQFWFHVPAAGERTIDAWWPSAPDRSSKSPFVVRDASGKELARIAVDQRTNGGKWVTLGKWSFPAGWSRVELRRDTGEAGRFVIADALRVR